VVAVQPRYFLKNQCKWNFSGIAHRSAISPIDISSFNRLSSSHCTLTSPTSCSFCDLFTCQHCTRA